MRIDTLQGLDGALQEALAIDPSAWFEAQTLAAIQRSPTRRRNLLWWPAVEAVAALLVLGTLGRGTAKVEVDIDLVIPARGVTA